MSKTFGYKTEREVAEVGKAWCADKRLKIVKMRTFSVLTADEVQRLVKEKFGVAFELCTEEEWGGGFHAVSASTKAFSPQNKDCFENWCAGGDYPYIHNIMSALAFVGAIPEGEYLIEVLW